MKIFGALLLLVGAASAVELTPDNWDAETAGALSVEGGEERRGKGTEPPMVIADGFRRSMVLQ